MRMDEIFNRFMGFMRYIQFGNIRFKREDDGFTGIEPNTQRFVIIQLNYGDWM